MRDLTTLSLWLDAGQVKVASQAGDQICGAPMGRVC